MAENGRLSQIIHNRCRIEMRRGKVSVNKIDVKEQSRKPSPVYREGANKRKCQRSKSMRGARAPGRGGRSGARSGYFASDCNRLSGFNVILVRFDGLAMGCNAG